MQQQIGHVDHVVFIYKKENLSRMVEEFGKVLNITDWDGPEDVPYFGVFKAQSLEAGLELVAPLSDEGPLADHLRTHGEGFYALIYGVKDIFKAVEHAQKHDANIQLDENGKPLLLDCLTIIDGKPVHASWESRTQKYLEVPLTLGGLNCYLSEIVPAK